MRGAGLLIGLAILSGAVQAESPRDAAALRVATLAASCAACHGSEGRAVPQAEIPGLAGMPAPYLREQMLAFQHGTRPGTVMPQLAKGYTAAQIDLLAAYFAQLRAGP